MLMGENSRAVSQRAAAKLAEVNRSLPQGVKAKAVYDRTALVERDDPDGGDQPRSKARYSWSPCCSSSSATGAQR